MDDSFKLQAFLLAAKHRSFSLAARDLHITQPALSFQIKTLENLYATKLFLRKGRSVEPTEAGRILELYARKILTLVQESREAIAEVSKQGPKRLSVGGGNTSGPYVLATLIGAYKQFHPEIEVFMKIGTFEQLLHMLAEGEIDLFLSRQPPLSLEIGHVCEPYGEMSMRAVASPNHLLSRKRNVTVNQLAQESFILQRKGSIGRDLINSFFTKRNLFIKVCMEFESLEAVKAAVRENFGISILNEPSIMSEVTTRALKILQVPELKISYPLFIFYGRDKRLSAAAMDFLTFLRLRSAVQKSSGKSGKVR
jgi:LysR family transcriptional regulator, low CO2-responsive transcriptional regulator